jgi:hypothetical protein
MILETYDVIVWVILILWLSYDVIVCVNDDADKWKGEGIEKEARGGYWEER